MNEFAGNMCSLPNINLQYDRLSRTNYLLPLLYSLSAEKNPQHIRKYDNNNIIIILSRNRNNFSIKGRHKEKNTNGNNNISIVQEES